MAEAICARFSQPVIVARRKRSCLLSAIVDNFIIHCSKATRLVLKCYADRLEPCELPTYAPQLNLIELLWKHLRRKVTHNYLFESVAALIAAVEQFFAELDNQPATVLSVIGCAE
jgi:transposase